MKQGHPEAARQLRRHPGGGRPGRDHRPEEQGADRELQQALDSDGLAFYPDWPVPGYYDVLVSGVQKLINGTKTPDQVLDEIAGPYNENVADIGN